jgi:outer membrane protein OmpA-like peptidoglycan-associated protein
VRPDTIGAREQVTAKYELMPRGQYTLNVQPAQLHTFAGDGPKLSYDRYEAVLELYQAENAVQIARSLGADQYAAESMSKAVTLLNQAQDMDARRMDTHAIVSAAREAAQMAEDARTIAVKRSEGEHQARVVQHLEEKNAAIQQQAAQQAQIAQAQVDQAQADEAAAQAERARAQAAEAHADAVQQAALAPPPPPAQPVVVAPAPDATQQQYRAQLLAQLNSSFTTRDTPRGLVVMVTDSMFGHEGLHPAAGQRLANVAAILASNPGLSAQVEGYADSESQSQERAQIVRAALIAQGARPSAVVAIGYGDSRPIASNATPGGRDQNRRVEVVIYGPSIGKALWDRGYPLRSGR